LFPFSVCLDSVSTVSFYCMLFWPNNRFLLCVKKGCFRLRLTFWHQLLKFLSMTFF
jgi:hypothetical protein